MTQEEKQLLLKDLCARLPYGVIVQYKGHNTIKKIKFLTGSDLDCNMEYYKPYLRPMSSMTEEEKKQFDKFICIDEDAWIGKGIEGYINQSIIMSDGIDYLNKNHFDYRGLIPKKLAIEVTKENNLYKE